MKKLNLAKAYPLLLYIYIYHIRKVKESEGGVQVLCDIQIDQTHCSTKRTAPFRTLMANPHLTTYKDASGKPSVFQKMNPETLLQIIGPLEYDSVVHGYYRKKDLSVFVVGIKGFLKEEPIQDGYRYTLDMTRDIDPSWTMSEKTPEIQRINTHAAIQRVREAKGLNIEALPPASQFRFDKPSESVYSTLNDALNALARANVQKEALENMPENSLPDRETGYAAFTRSADDAAAAAMDSFDDDAADDDMDDLPF